MTFTFSLKFYFDVSYLYCYLIFQDEDQVVVSLSHDEQNEVPVEREKSKTVSPSHEQQTEVRVEREKSKTPLVNYTYTFFLNFLIT